MMTPGVMNSRTIANHCKRTSKTWQALAMFDAVSPTRRHTDPRAVQQHSHRVHSDASTSGECEPTTRSAIRSSMNHPNFGQGVFTTMVDSHSNITVYRGASNRPVCRSPCGRHAGAHRRQRSTPAIGYTMITGTQLAACSVPGELPRASSACLRGCQESALLTRHKSSIGRSCSLTST